MVISHALDNAENIGARKWSVKPLARKEEMITRGATVNQLMNGGRWFGHRAAQQRAKKPSPAAFPEGSAGRAVPEARFQLWIVVATWLICDHVSYEGRLVVVTCNVVARVTCVYP